MSTRVLRAACVDVIHLGERLSEAQKARLVQEQKLFFDNDFKRYLRESAEEDDSFLVKFVGELWHSGVVFRLSFLLRVPVYNTYALCALQECATGSNYVPYDDKSFKINIEFSFSVDPVDWLPVFHACTGDVVLPSTMQYIDYKTFKEDKMNWAIREVYNQFHMN